MANRPAVKTQAAQPRNNVQVRYLAGYVFIALLLGMRFHE